ncbi:translocation/assembly module TamB domain-containing protein [Arenimonas terrae]|uniref:Translocation/assembly module TamB n=1 Tax=Arenimonas terrae TaxID=2546226 RepID=A0A5C4RNM9_9GAMM|nr:translocation/assembly module TamB domain-containing protein [Arenimonas terrae]TNJ32722.1 translocation/assembly module TamB [Arenimonas terrae]
MSAPAAKPPRSFARRWSRRLGLGSGLLALATLALLLWLLQTTAGRDTLLGRVLGLLPPDSLSWQRAEGTVSGPLELFGVRYSHDGVTFTAERVLLDPDVLPVLGRRLQLDRLEVDGAVLVLPPSVDEPFALPTWPEVLPRLPMPLRIRSERLDVDGLRIERDDTTLIDIATIEASALRLVGDGFEADALALDSNRGRLTLKGEYRPDRNFRTDLAATWAVAATDTAPAANLQLSAKGDLDEMRLDLAGRAPQPLSLSLDLRESAAVPVWTFASHSEGFDPALFGAAPGEILAWQLDANGRGGEAQLQGEVIRGDWRIGIESSRLVLASQMLRAEPLKLVLPQGPLQLEGKLLVDGDHAAFDTVLRSPGLRLEPATTEPGASAVTARGELHAAGTFDHWSLAGDATLARAGEEAQVQLEGIGDGEQLALRTLRADTPTGSLDGRGTVRWAPALAFELEAALAGFDPGYFLPDYPGALSGDLVADATQRDDGQWTGKARVENLSGELRDRAVSGRLLADWNGDRGSGEADLRIGGSVLGVRGGFGAVYDLQAQFAPLDLSDLVAGASGLLDGNLQLRGPADALDYAAELQGAGLVWNGQRADRLRLSGTLPARGDSGAFEVSGEGLQLAGLALDRLDARGTGSLAAMQLQGAASGELGELSLAGNVARSGAEWRGRIEQLRLAAKQAPVLTLENGAGFRYGPNVLQLDRSCLVAEAMSGRLCLAAQGDSATIEGESVPLALAQPWLTPDQDLVLQVDGTLDLRADLRRGRDGAWRGEGQLTSAEGALRLDEDLERDVFGYTNLVVQLQLDGDAVDGELSAALADNGSVRARLRTGLADTATMDGELQLDVRDLTWLELFSEDLAGPTGRLQGRLLIAGTRAEPAFSGQARLQQFAAELPALGLKLREGEADLAGTADGAVRVDGRVASGDGVLRLDGSLNFRDDTAPLQLVLVGEKVTLASTPELYVIANPDLTLRWLGGGLEVRGTLDVPEARVDLEALDSDVTISPDVVVVDPLDGPRERATPLDLDFAVTLGENVKLKGFGLDGAMTGRLALREAPGRRAVATGTLQVTGKYRAYGQALTIERARLGFADSPYDNPTLDIRAEREFDEVTVGVQVRGTARRPETTVVSSPAMETSEALSWLVFGRPLSTTTSNESEQLSATALALGAGGNLVAQQLGAQLGLDEAGVTDSRNLGGATFTIGKYVSPRLFLSYGVSLIGSGQVVTLKYLLTRGFDISIEQGNESAASLNWRRER